MKKIISVVAVCFFLFSCSKPGGTDNGGTGNGGSGGGTTCSGPAKSFTTDVNPVIQGSCATSQGCHGVGSTAGPGPLLTFSQVFNARTSIRSAVSSGRMPPNGSLSATQKNAIICWIDAGAPNN
jgi:hypothetical protein